MKWLSDRISFHRHDEYTTILISTKVEKWKEGLLLGWMVLWSLAGMAMLFVLFSDSYLTQLSTNTPKNQLQLFLVLFLKKMNQKTYTPKEKVKILKDLNTTRSGALDKQIQRHKRSIWCKTIACQLSLSDIDEYILDHFDVRLNLAIEGSHIVNLKNCPRIIKSELKN